ncbi:hypothetical protein PIROE2DRAFT_31019, partial [Piromyces sp. E2]
NEKGITALQVAAENGNADLVQCLVSHGADLDHPSHTGNTALMFAAAGGHLSTVKYLVEAGAKLE